MHPSEAVQPPAIDAKFGSGIRLERYRHPPGPSAPIPAHSHEEYQFGLSLDTAGEYRYRRARHLVPAGAVRAIQAGESHASRDFGAETPTSTHLLYVAPSVLTALVGLAAPRSATLPFFSEPFLIDHELAERFLSTFVALAAGPAWRLAQDEALLATLTRLARHGRATTTREAAGRETAAVASVKDYLDAKAEEPVALADLARIVGLSPTYLCRAFAAEVGVPPHRYQLQRRLEQAKCLLVAGASVAEAARRTGFADQSHLGRHFRRHAGVSPGRFRAFGDRPDGASDDRSDGWRPTNEGGT